MNNNPQPEPDTAAEPAGRHRPPLLLTLAGLLALEAALMIGVVVWSLVQLLASGEKGDALVSGVAIIVVAAIGAIWVTATAIAVFRVRSWSRGAAVMWQLIQLAVAIGCFQGVTAVPALGWVLLVPSIVGILIAVSPQVTAALRRG